jgi:hypothetical protein
MEVKVTDEKKNVNLELGDVIVYYDNVYLVVDESNGLGSKIIARNFKGNGGLFGHHKSLSEFNKAFCKCGLDKESIVYKATEYELHLVKKK